ncbi:hypothetical protein AJ79_09167 [Helicocarpus griseus UAMH5409]|uniref:GED domain-containing protein n=1 Tax=Helicocarpus griseus UAMH5409 TaxID=1447875 RepID=A0A2B7WLQ5_9EURO|nr:hypothetical protein AJ79_09167 [Helicocarpus griseus UAMH5409]
MEPKTTTYNKLADPALLEKIDKLFACNVGNHIDLPQLVVVGDQSSGKSSVLEGLTKLPFPRDSGLCTRHATQITFRRTTEKRVTVSIIPGADATSEHAARVRSWEISNLRELDSASFSEIMTKVNEVMGLRDPKSKAVVPGNTFSTDVLRIEVCGPGEDHLSIIDVPGIFKNTTSGSTTKEDIQLVRNMVQSFMQNPRSILIATIPANVDIATQEILEMAKEVDPEGERTVGVFTKPDLVDTGAEKKVIDLLEGKESGWKMGWSLVRNPGQQDLDEGRSDRDKSEETFFKTKSPWNSIDKDKVGVNSLRVRLQEILTTHIRREFPHVKSEISKALAAKKRALQSLGPERDSTDSQGKFLLDIITEFQQIVSLAMSSDYGGNDLFDREPDAKLPTILATRNDEFSENMERWGHLYSFAHIAGDAGHEDGNGGIPSEDDGDKGEDRDDGDRVKPKIRSMSDPEGLEDILYEPVILQRAVQTDIMSWLEKTFRSCRGFEIATYNPRFLSTLIKKQTVNWESLAFGYVSDMICAVHSFILKVLKAVCTDERVRGHLLSILMDRLVEIYQRSLAQVRFLLHVERAGTPMTLNHYFNDNLEKCRQKRMEASMRERAIAKCSHGEVVRLKDIVHHNPMSNVEHTVHDLHDTLKSYYKVARKRFVDSVCMQAADYHLVTGPETPLKQFSPAFVQSLSPEQLEEIAGEDSKLKRKRAQLHKEISELEAGRKILL